MNKFFCGLFLLKLLIYSSLILLLVKLMFSNYFLLFNNFQKMKKKLARRNFIQFGVMGSASFLTLPLKADNKTRKKDAKNMLAIEGTTLLFQGDSITDGRRNRKDLHPNTPTGLGNSYVALIASELLGKHPDKGYNIFNRGISGNKVPQLADRWQADCLELQPSILSILIGVNDFWHMSKHGYKGTLETYERDYRDLIQNTLKKLPQVKIIICEPFMVPGGTALEKGWPEAFAAYRVVARKLALEFELPFVSFQEIFYEGLEMADASHWCPDGVHPGPAGNYLMAKAWLEVFYQMNMD